MKLYQVAIVVASDKGFSGEREDKSGPLICQMMEEEDCEVVSCDIVPDEIESIEQILRFLSDDKKVNLVLTSGGTGFSLRDVTPEATLAVGERQVPGISEAIRLNSLKITPKAMLSRGVSVIRKQTLIINLPGSPKGAKESLEAILPTIFHGIDVLKGDSTECAQAIAPNKE